MEPQKPPVPKPTDPTPPPSQPTTPWISPRLREKLDEPGGGRYGREHQDGPPAWLGLVLAILVIGGGAALLLTMRGSAAKEKTEAAERAKVAAAAAAAESIAAVARADSMRIAMAAADSIRARMPGAKKPAPPSAPVATRPPAGAPAGGATPPAAPPKAPAEAGPFGLDVGTFLVEDRAASEQARISTASGLKGQVKTVSEDGSDVYHVVVGSFPTRAAAERKAAAMVAAGQVNQARTVPLR